MESELLRKRCAACGGEKLSDAAATELLRQTPGWTLSDGALRREFHFKNYHEVMAFVNATAWVSHREDHHPDMEVGYNRVRMAYVTHSAGGVTEKDFVCAAKVGELVQEVPGK